MPLQATSGAASYDAFGGGVPAEPNYIESCFSTWLYTGTDLARTITNGIDLSGKGGLVWIKPRDFADNHNLFDTARGATNRLFSNLTNAQSASATTLTAFTNSGFSLGNNGAVNGGDFLYASWTFREQPKFFDVVTWTGDGTSSKTVSHNLGSVPGCIIIKRTDSTGSWWTYHRSLGNTDYLTLNTTNATQTSSTIWNSTTPTDTVFSVGNTSVNTSGATYVAYLFAHNAGGFGLTGTDNVVSCGSYTASGSSGTVTLGYEPQWILIKNSDGGASGTANWVIVDNMRGMPVGSNDNVLYPNSSSAEVSSQRVAPTATGFSVSSASGNLWDNGASYIYIAIRRGPMKVPTSGLSVYGAATGVNTNPSINVGFPVDMMFSGQRSGSDKYYWINRLTGVPFLNSTSTAAQDSGLTNVRLDNMTGAFENNFNGYFGWGFRRAPGFMDVCCYTGTGASAAVTHNLGVAPELSIIKSRSLGVENWNVWQKDMGTSSPGNYYYLVLNGTNQRQSANDRVSTATSTVVNMGDNDEVNKSGSTYVMYLFATCAGVSKVGLYTGTGTTLQIDCGFTGGARFVLIKCFDSSGAWYVWDSARGIVSGNDPYLLLNSTSAEVTNTDYIDTYSAGFEISSTAPDAINKSGDRFIFLAIA
jgi:hypothetical protein